MCGRFPHLGIPFTTWTKFLKIELTSSTYRILPEFPPLCPYYWSSTSHTKWAVISHAYYYSIVYIYCLLCLKASESYQRNKGVKILEKNKKIMWLCLLQSICQWKWYEQRNQGTKLKVKQPEKTYRAMETRNRVKIYPDVSKFSFQIAKEKRKYNESSPIFCIIFPWNISWFISGTGQRSWKS